jgi:hypothetical protein
MGTGKLSDHLAALNQGSFEAFYSSMSAKAQGITQEHVLLANAQPAMPAKLVQLTAGCDKVLLLRSQGLAYWVSLGSKGLLYG